MGNCTTKSKRKEIFWKYNPIPQLNSFNEDNDDEERYDHFKWENKQEEPEQNNRPNGNPEQPQKNSLFKKASIDQHMKVSKYFKGVISQDTILYEFKQNFDSIRKLYEELKNSDQDIILAKESLIYFMKEYMNYFSDQFQENTDKFNNIQEAKKKLEIELEKSKKRQSTFQEVRSELDTNEYLLQEKIKEQDDEDNKKKNNDIINTNLELLKKLNEEKIKLENLEGELEQSKFFIIQNKKLILYLDESNQILKQKGSINQHINQQMITIGNLEKQNEFDQILVEKSHFIFVVNERNFISNERFNQSISGIKQSITLLKKVENQNYKFSLFLFNKNKLKIIFENKSQEEVQVNLEEENRQLEEIENLDDIFSELILKIKQYEKPILTFITSENLSLKDEQIPEWKEIRKKQNLLFFCFGVQNSDLSFEDLDQRVQQINGRDSIKLGSQIAYFMNYIVKQVDLSDKIKNVFSRLIEFGKKSGDQQIKHLKIYKEANTQIREFKSDKKKEENSISENKEINEINQKEKSILSNDAQKLKEENFSFEEKIPILLSDIAQLKNSIEDRQKELTKNEKNIQIKDKQKIDIIGVKNTDFLLQQLITIKLYINTVQKVFNQEIVIIDLYKKIELDLMSKIQLYQKSMSNQQDLKMIKIIMQNVFNKNKKTDFLQELKKQFSNEQRDKDKIDEKNINKNQNEMFNQSSSLLSKIFDQGSNQQILLKIIQDRSGNSERDKELFDKLGVDQQNQKVCVSEFCNQLSECFQYRKEEYFQQQFKEHKFLIERDLSTLIEFDLSFNMVEQYCCEYKKESLKMILN